MTKFVCISDTHARQGRLHHPIPSGDVLLFGGDIMTCGYRTNEIKDFLVWFSSLPHKHKIFIAGNHDRKFENDREYITDMLKEHQNEIGLINAPHYLEDKEVIVDGWKVYGSPWQPEFCGWAFNLPRNGKEIESKWNAIPDDTDVLITHGPPFGTLDYSPHVCPSVGCEVLAERMKIVKPKIHLFGHIHGGYGVRFDETTNTHYVNASLVDERYEPVNAPIIIELNK